jgi:hypothetical protein
MYWLVSITLQSVDPNYQVRIDRHAIVDEKNPFVLYAVEVFSPYSKTVLKKRYNNFAILAAQVRILIALNMCISCPSIEILWSIRILSRVTSYPWGRFCPTFQRPYPLACSQKCPHSKRYKDIKKNS